LSRSSATAVQQSQELARFLLARIDEDELELKQLGRNEEAGSVGGIRALGRMRAELDAKRRLIGSLQQLVVLRDQPAERAVRHQAEHMLRFLALPYEWHAGYRSEWRPAGSH
jgi:hypothetical protein